MGSSLVSEGLVGEGERIEGLDATGRSRLKGDGERASGSAVGAATGVVGAGAGATWVVPEPSLICAVFSGLRARSFVNWKFAFSV